MLVRETDEQVKSEGKANREFDVEVEREGQET